MADIYPLEKSTLFADIVLFVSCKISPKCTIWC